MPDDPDPPSELGDGEPPIRYGEGPPDRPLGEPGPAEPPSPEPPQLPEGWEDFEPMEDPTIRRAIADHIEPIEDLVEADLPGWPDEGEPGEAEHQELLDALDEAVEEIPLFVPPKPDMDLGPDIPPVPPKRKPRVVLSLILGSFGLAGIIAVGVLSLFKSDEPTTTTQPSIISTTTLAIGLPSEPTTQSESQTAVVEEPQTPPEDEPQTVAAEPVDYVTITETVVLVDPAGDVWVVATPAASWAQGPPATDTAWGLIVGVGVDLGYQINASWWTLYDGGTRGEGSIVGENVRAALDGEMWVTPDGELAVKLPGSSPTGGLPITDVGSDAEIYLFGQLWPEESSDIQSWEDTTPLGEITQTADLLPRPDWQAVEVDFGPVILIVPGS